MNIEFNWFVGVVEDRLDPLKLGRCRVRILGKHTEVKKNIKTEDLPWAWPMHPITSAAVNGIGEIPGLVEGSWVVGFFRDGADSQEPIIMGSIPGIPKDYPYPLNKNIGFLDPRTDLSKKPRKIKSKSYPNDGNGAVLVEEVPTPEGGQLFPKQVNPYGNVLEESDTNRLARNDEKIIDTIVTIKKENRDKEIPIADGSTWDEPETPYDSSYPYNHCFESESGHIREVDDTRGGERLHEYHRSGTFTEIYPDGVKVEKIVGNSYRIVLEEQYEHIQNRYNLTIDGPWNVIVQNNATIIVKGDANIKVGGDMTTEVGGDYSLKVGGSATIESANTTVKSSGTTVVGAGGTVALKGSAVTASPGVDVALGALKASVLSPVTAKGPSPQSVSSPNAPSDTLDRTYPKEAGPYVVVKEDV